MKIFLAGIVGYGLGNFLSAFFLGKIIQKKDIRTLGSHNPGSTNAFRVFGYKIGLAAFLMDFLKAVLASYLGQRIAGYYGMLASAFMVVIGHNWPIVLRFKGGKGIAASAGVILFLSYKLFLLLLLVFFLSFSITRIVSISSILAATIAAIVGGVVMQDIYGKLLFIILGMIAIYRHKENIKRLIAGEEKALF